MNTQEAITFLKETIAGCKFTKDKQLKEVCEMSISALEKQIPRKPILKEIKCFDGSTADFVFICSVCNRTICIEPEDDVIADHIKEEHPHCNCGQALDWSDNNAE